MKRGLGKAAQTGKAGLVTAIGFALVAWSIAGRAGAQTPLTLLQTVAIPQVTAGDFDHFAVDSAANRLYVSAEAHHSIEVFDLQTNAHLRSVGGVTTPHTIVSVPDQQALYVADGGDASIRVLAGDDLHQIARIPLPGNPDAGLYDPASRTFFVGVFKPGETSSTISMISVDERREVSRITVPTTNIESMVIDHATNRLIVNLRDKNEIGIIDLAQHRLTSRWSIPEMKHNTTMQLDSAGRRLFVAGRQPGMLFVIDADNGRLIAHYQCTETADDMTYDAQTHRIYISGAGGLDVFAQNDPDTYQSLAHYDTDGGKTSVEVPALHRFFVVHTKSTLAEAGLQVFQIK